MHKYCLAEILVGIKFGRFASKLTPVLLKESFAKVGIIYCAKLVASFSLPSLPSLDGLCMYNNNIIIITILCVSDTLLFFV